MKKILSLFIILIISFPIISCTKEKDENNFSSTLNGSLSKIMEQVYTGMGNDKPKLQEIELTSENLPFYLGIESLDFKEGLASEPLINVNPHSIVLVRVNDGVDIEKTKTEIKEKIDPRKWICVSVDEDNVIVDNIGNLIILIMDNNYSKELQKSFKNLDI